MKTINLELSKRLTEGGYLDNIETEFGYEIAQQPNEDNYNMPVDFWRLYERNNTRQESNLNYFHIKALTLEEAIEFLPDVLSYYFYLHFGRNRDYKGYYVKYEYDGVYKDACFYGKTLLEPVEKMIEYLLDNNLLTK